MEGFKHSFNQIDVTQYFYCGKLVNEDVSSTVTNKSQPTLILYNIINYSQSCHM